MIHNRSNIKFINYTLIAFFTILIGFFLIVMPKHIDDLRFMNYTSVWFFDQGIINLNEGGNIFVNGLPFKEIWQTWSEELWVTDNIRLGNLISVIMLLFPKWLISSFSVLIWIWCMIGSFKIAGVDFRRSPLILLALILWGVFLPWRDNMGAIVLQFNYIWCTGLSLYLLSILFKHKFNLFSESRIDTIKKIIFIFLVSFCIGWWHEGFSASIILGLSSLLFCQGKYCNKFLISAITGLLAGTFIIAITPGTINRINLQVDVSPIGLNIKLYSIFIINILYFSSCALFLFYTVFKKNCRISKDSIVIFCLVSGLVPIIISLLTYTAGRVTWWTQTVSVIGLLRIINLSGGNYWKSYRLSNQILLIPCAVFVAAYWIISDKYALENRIAYDKCIENYIGYPSKNLFADIKTQKDFPFELFGLPPGNFLSNYEFQEISKLYRKKNPNLNFVILPIELKNADGKTGKKIEGLSGARLYEDLIYVPNDSIDIPDFTLTRLKVDYGKGFVPVDGYLYSFISEKDGRKYKYIRLQSPWFVQNFRSPVGIRLSDSP